MNASLVQEILFGTQNGVKQYIEMGADLEAIDEYGFTPLIEAVIANKIDIALLLLEQKIDVNQQDATGRSALHWAVDNHNLELSRVLLANKADPNTYTFAGQPPLVYPLLRQQLELKSLLYDYEAKLDFAQDFISAKLLGHRYELKGKADIINPTGQFIEIDYEGFFLEFTLDVIINSLRRYQNNFAARDLRHYFDAVQQVLHAMRNAQALLKYQRYYIKIQEHYHSIDFLFEQPLLFLPLAYEGHAISLIKYKDWVVRCDRGELGRREGCIVVYQIMRPYAWTKALCRELFFKRQNAEFLQKGLNRLLDLKEAAIFPISEQKTGNCSWANIEAAIPAMLFILQMDAPHPSSFLKTPQDYAIDFFHTWQKWDKDRALEVAIQSFYYSDKPRQASQAMILAAVLFQLCSQYSQNITQLETLLKPLTLPDYRYLIQSYLNVYWKMNKTPQGKQLLHYLDLCGVNSSIFI